MADEVKPIFQAGMCFPTAPCLVVDNAGTAWWMDPVNFRLFRATETTTKIVPPVGPSFMQEEQNV